MLSTSLALLAAPTLFADVLVVSQFGGGDFVDLQNAIDAAQEGDTVLVRSNLFPFSGSINGKSLKVVGDVGALTSLRDVVVQGLGPGQTVVLSNLFIGGTPGSGQALTSSNNLGTVLVQDCVVAGADSLVTIPTSGSRVENSASVTFAGCEIRAGQPLPGSPAFEGPPGLRVADSSVNLFDCTVLGGTGTLSSVTGSPGGDGGDGILATQSELFLSGTAATGGSGGAGVGAFAPTSSPCSDGGDAGAGLRLTSGSLTHRDSSFAAGQPGAGGAPNGGLPGCAAGSSAPSLDVAGGNEVALSGIARSLSVTPNPVRAGQVATATFSGTSGDLLIWAVSTSASSAPLFDFGGPVVPGLPATLLTPGALDANGLLSLDFPISPLAVGLDSIDLFEQAVHLDVSLNLIAGKPVFVTHLDASF